MFWLRMPACPGVHICKVDPSNRLVVFVAPVKNAEGKWTTSRVNVGKDGVAPMM